MKKLFASAAMAFAMLLTSGQVQAQSILGGFLKNVLSGNKDNTTNNTGSSSNGGGDILSALTNIFSNSLVATEDQIIGTWVYEEPAVVMSSESTLKNIGGKIMASTIEGQLKSKLETYGIKKGCITMTFDKEGNFTQTFNKTTLKGTYTIEEKNIILKYSGKVSQIIGTTQLDGNNLLIVMDATKLISFVNVLGSVTQNSTLQTAASLIGSFDGLECGLRLLKQ